MAGLMDYMDPDELQRILAMMGPSADDKKQARSLGLLSAGLALLGTQKGREMEGIGRSGLLGVGAYQNELQDLSRQKFQGIGARSALMNMGQQEQTMRDQMEARKLYGQMPAMGQSGNAPMPQGNAPNAPAQAPDYYSLYMQRAAQLDQLNASGNPVLTAQAEKYREHALKFRDENAGMETVMGPNGQPQIVQRKKFGAPEVMQGMQPKPEMQVLSLGDRDVAIDKLRVQPGQSWQQGMPPAAAASNQVALANLGVSQAHLKLAQDKATQEKGEQYGTPIQVTAGDGSTALYAPQKGTSNLVPMTGPDNKPLVKSASIPQAYKDKSYSLANLRDSLSEYKDAVSKYSAADYMKPTVVTEVGSKFTAMQMGLKNLYELGALAGPDIEILERQMTNPASAKGLVHTREMLKTQVDVVEKMLQKAEHNLAKAYGQKSRDPGATGAAALSDEQLRRALGL